MDKYENLEIVGEGSYGVVMKCRHRETGQIVAIKKFLATEEDIHVRRLAFREIRTLKKLHHENLVNMIEVFRRRKRFYLVFEYLDHTVLDELEEVRGGLGHEISRRYIFQVLRGLNFCHSHQIMHRDIKPENILVSVHGVIKLCDFGFARMVGGARETYTDYVATRWYRAPELLVGNPKYGRAVDVWAAGCLYAEMVTGDPLFPGESDIDQLHKIVRIIGDLAGKNGHVLGYGNMFGRLKHSSVDDFMMIQWGKSSLRATFPTWSAVAIDFLRQCLRMDPDVRPKCSVLLEHPLFTQDNFTDKFLEMLRQCISQDAMINPLLSKKDEERRVSALATEPMGRQCRSNIGKWNMELINDPKQPPQIRTDSQKSEFTESQEEVEEAVIQERVITRPREPCYLGPVSVVPNTTFIRRLDHRGLLIPGSKDFSLPDLVAKDRRASATRMKGKKLDFPGIDR